MKRFIIIIFVLFVTVTGFSQSFNTKKSSSVDELKNRFYFRGGYSTPAWKYYGFTDASELMQSLNVESKIGANFEIGSIFMLNKIRLGRGARFGINVDYLNFPSDVKWNFTVNQEFGNYVYSSSGSSDFEIHEFDQPLLVSKILAYAGVLSNDQLATSLASSKEQKIDIDGQK